MIRAFAIIFVLILSSTPFAQTSVSKLLSKADKHVKKHDYSPALQAYSQVLAIEPNNKKAIDGKAEIFLNGYQLYDSAAVYIDKQLQTIGKDTNYLVFYNYANCLRLQEKHKEAIKQYNFFKDHGMRKARPDDPLLREVEQNINYSLNAIKNMELIYEPFEVENLDFFINSVDAEYTPVYIEDQNLLLYNARYKDYDKEHMDADNLYFENIYYFDLEESVASTYNPGIEQKTHQCVVGKVFDSDSILVFYQNRVWMSSMESDRLNQLSPLPEEFGNYYFQPHGAFSKDQNTFVFSARGQFDNLDLYVSNRVNGTWSAPEPISVKINSGEDEDAPFLSADGKTLYFSSKGHGSSGGYDFYKSHLVDGEWSIPTNLGYPMNSAGDDIYLTWNSDERSGFFSSNRNEGFGKMDIYSFGLVKKGIKGQVFDKDGNILSDAKVELIDPELGTIETIVTDVSGTFSFLVDPEKSFELKAEKEKYFMDMKDVNTMAEDDVVYVDLILEKDPGISLYIQVLDAQSDEPIDSVKVSITDNMVNKTDSLYTDAQGDYFMPLPDKKLKDRGSYNLTLEKDGYLVITVTYNVLFDKEGQYNVLEDLHIKMEKIEVGLDLNDVIDVNPIYFDYNKSIIRADAAIELDKIVQVMNDNPDMKIELGSHTDARGSNTANQKLSDRRAKASADYIRQRITDPSRITGKGYGESKLVNECADGVKCTEVQHQENRRTEFIIIEM